MAFNQQILLIENTFDNKKPPIIRGLFYGCGIWSAKTQIFS
jgi:hypothetical protein